MWWRRGRGWQLELLSSLLNGKSLRRQLHRTKSDLSSGIGVRVRPVT
jgi:hypothetical protein